MATKADGKPEIEELRSRLEWLDEERRKSQKRIAEMEKRVGLQEREIESRNRRVKELEDRLASLTSQVTRLPQVDSQMAQFKDEVVALIEKYDQRRIQADEEMERLRRVEHEGNVREIAEVRKELPAIPRLQNEMELRQAEEARLANLIGMLQNRLPAIESRIENWTSDLSYLAEAEARNTRNLAELQTSLVEISRRWDPIYGRLDLVTDKAQKLENNFDSLIEAQANVRQIIKNWAEQIQLGEYERNQRLNNWERLLEQQKDVMQTYAQQWVTFSDQYKEARMAVQTLVAFQQQIEQQQREANELVRVEVNRMQTRWDAFVAEHEKRWKNFEVDMDQRIASSTRSERQLREHVGNLEDMIAALEQELERVYRVQSAQADAIKQFPRVWQEAVEKSMTHDPNRRRQPALVPVREEERE
jgi:DNA repair exonuclease SbcCD ATPase subunit